jgi:hypothetical protein
LRGSVGQQTQLSLFGELSAIIAFCFFNKLIQQGALLKEMQHGGKFLISGMLFLCSHAQASL